MRERSKPSTAQCNCNLYTSFLLADPRNEEVGFLFGVAHNRKVSLEPGQDIQIQTWVIPESGLMVYLKEFGWVKVFCQDFKNEARYYSLLLPKLDALKPLTRERFKQVHDRLTIKSLSPYIGSHILNEVEYVSVGS